jgi:hypothetical protein
MVACCALGVSGCAGGEFSGPDQAGASIASQQLAGLVHGGEQPIAGAHIYLFAANTAGYAGNGIPASSSNASVSLLTVAEGAALDNSGGATNGDYYLTTDSQGRFSIASSHSCVPGTQVYLYAFGGNPGPGANPAVGLMAVLGSCPAAGNFLEATQYILVNEVSTIAAAYALAGFATDATHVSSSGTPPALTGIANAFANAANLETLSTGVALSQTPGGNGTVPQAEIDMLANILAACVNTAGPGSTGCSTLLSNATGSAGVAPLETATAAINIAHHPGANVATLFALPVASSPFAPWLAAQPNAFTVALRFTGGGIDSPKGIAIDGSDNVWIANQGSDSVTELSGAGSPISGASGYTGGGLAGPTGIAIDLSGDAWIANYPGNVVSELSNTGVPLSVSSGYSGGGPDCSVIAVDGAGDEWIPNPAGYVSELSSSGSPVAGSPFTGGGLNASTGVAIDGGGNIWVTNQGGGDSITKLSSTGSILSGGGGYLAGGLNMPSGIAIDASGDAWIANANGASVTELSSAGSPAPGSPYTGGGLDGPQGIAIDGSGDAWIANKGSLSVTELSSSGAVLSGANGYTAGLSAPQSIAIDGSGDVWLTDSSSNAAIELLGAGTPVVTPLAAGVENGTLGTRP